ncbi:IS1182 family transposase [Pseudomonadota bacterium]
MARFKDTNYDQVKMIPVSFDRQILPDSFEFTLSQLIDHYIDLSPFEARFTNSSNGRPAYNPAILLKIIILAYSKGITSSRKIEQLCRDNILFMAISADSQPHFTTLADFISSSHEAIADLFQQVVLICDDLDLIGREMFAIDGCKMPSNASKEWSGKKADLEKKRQKIDRAVRYILKKHKETDQRNLDETLIDREKEQIRKLRKASRKIQRFLNESEERTGAGGRPVQSNITDNESAKMKTSHGVIQGYVGVSAVDSEDQVVLEAEAYGQGQEHDLLKPMVEGVRKALKEEEQEEPTLKNTKVLADSGYFSETTLKYLSDEEIDGYIADPGFRSRDPKFREYKKHKPEQRLKPKERFTQDDFKVSLKKESCRCPAGHVMWLKAKEAKIGHHLFMQFQAYEKDCNSCTLRKRCLKNERQKTARQINIKVGVTEERKDGLIEQMKRKIDSEQGRSIYCQRLGIVEPVFGHIGSAIGIKRFSLRGRKKVNGQWKLFNLLHNMLKIHRYGELCEG